MLSLQSGAVVIEQKILLILCGEIMEQTKGLVTSYREGGGATKRVGRGMYSTKRCGGKSVNHAEGGTQKVLW